MFDVPMSRKIHAHCDGVARRDFLRIGALAPLGFSMGQLLAAPKAQAAEGKGKAKSVILVYLGGGLSHHDSFDMKPDAPSEIRGKYTPIKSNVTGLHVCELMPHMAQTMDKVALIRSGSHNNDHHETATNWVLSGRFGSAFGDFPAMGAVTAHETGFRGALPPYVSIQRNPSFTWELGRSAYLGGKYESFKAGDPNAPNYKVRDLTAAEAIDAKRAERRKELLESVDSLSAKVKGDDQLGTFDEFHQRAAEMILSPQAQSAFDLEQEKKELRDRFGRTTFGQSCLLARRLVERGVKFVTINSGGWDHHAKIWDGLEKMLPDFDRGFSALIKDLSDRGLLSETLVACFGEFGRTPKINKDNGRDHFAPVASMVFAGAGVQGGRVIGASDRTGTAVTDRPVKPADVCATIYHALGIDPHGWLKAPDGRPIEILAEGDPVQELYV
ncbi:MAG: DUF1501 domain-containing protein [Planctomycetes bacterium]|nr:DUF1501 domain-containing protein [Planctomycetota bacterium]